MNGKGKAISRKDLYTQVWNEPVTKLAKRYGLSDVGFAKICKKHDIPGLLVDIGPERQPGIM